MGYVEYAFILDISVFISGLVGKVDPSDPNQVLLFTHKKIEVGYNGEQIVDVNVTADNKVVLKPNSEVIFTYEVIWKPSGIEFDKRFDKYLDPTFFQHRVSFSYLCSSYIFVSRSIGSPSSTPL